METKPALETSDDKLLQFISQALVLAGAALIFWAALVFLLQVLGWLKAGGWQPVPFGSVFLSEGGQRWLEHYQLKLHPFNVLPALGSAGSVQELAQSIAPSMLGVQKVLVFFLDLPLAMWFFFLGSVGIGYSTQISPARL